jgi:hypothetical protein
MASASKPFFCDHCSLILTPGQGEFYVVRIEAVADPTPPRIADHDQDLEEIRRQIAAFHLMVDPWCQDQLVTFDPREQRAVELSPDLSASSALQRDCPS